jgi:dihydroorotate dehydrogenase electron transfer subunit
MTSRKIQKARRIIAEAVECIDLAPVHPGHFRLAMDAPEVASDAHPGQFIHVLPPSTDLMLRRPFSILSADRPNGLVTILFRVIGEGTRMISEIGEGGKVDIIGPLGNGFPIDSDHPALLVGGGVGIPPLVFLAQKMISDGFSPDPDSQKSITVMVGAKDLATLVCYDDFHDAGIDPIIATEDGSAGVKGLVTDAMDRASDAIRRDTVVYACGPIPMLKAIAEWSAKHGLKCIVSLENKLGCGIGACLGCSIPVRDESGNVVYERVCCDGPAFDAGRVAFDLM